MLNMAYQLIIIVGNNVNSNFSIKNILIYQFIYLNKYLIIGKKCIKADSKNILPLSKNVLAKNKDVVKKYFMFLQLFLSAMFLYVFTTYIYLVIDYDFIIVLLCFCFIPVIGSLIIISVLNIIYLCYKCKKHTEQ